MTASDDHDSWDDLRYLKPQDCDELGYCVHCRSATVHKAGCVVVAKKGPKSCTCGPGEGCTECPR